MSMPLHSAPVGTQAPPYSPALIDLNNRYNMTASSLTEALLLLSGMYISLVQPEPGAIKVGLHAVFPRTLASFRNAITDPFSERNKFKTFLHYGAIPAVFDISTSYTRSEYAPKELLDMLCQDVFPSNTITIFHMNNHLGLQQYSPPAVRYLPRILESLGLPIISYDTQFSPNSRPALSIQLAPTMGQMMDVVFAFLKKFNWSDFSFLCTLSYGCQDEIASIRVKVDEFQRRSNVSVYGVDSFSYKLLSYVNFTDGKNRDEVKEKLKYELHKDSRINVVHGNGAEVKTIMDIARELGLTGEEYVWIFTAASISIFQQDSVVDESYPLGSFIIGYDSGRNYMEDVVKTGISLWLQALNSLATSEDFDNIDFSTGFSCQRAKDGMTQTGNNTSTSPLFWKYGEILYKYILRSKLPGGLKFDKYGVLEANKFWILNVQSEGSDEQPGEGHEGGTSGHGHTSSAGGSYGPLQAGHGYLLDTKLPPLSHKAGDVKDTGPSVSWGRGSRLPVARDRNFRFPFPSDSNSVLTNQADSTGQHLRSQQRKSRSSRGPKLLPSQRHHSGISRSTNRVMETPLTHRKVPRSISATRDSSLPLFKHKSDSSHSPRTSSFRLQFPQDRYSGMSAVQRNSGLPFSRNIKSEWLIYRHQSSSAVYYKVPKYSYSRSTPSSYYQVSSSTYPELSYNTAARSAAFSPTSNTSLSFHILSGDSKSSSTPLIISSERVSPGVAHRFSSEEFSESQQKFIYWQNQAPVKLPYTYYKKARHRKNVFGHRHSHGVHNNTHTLEVKASSQYLHLQRRFGNDHTEVLNDRPRRAVSRKQIAKKIADWNGHNLSMAGIIWPGGNLKPPKGKPEKYILRVVTWKEDPHVIYLERRNSSDNDAGTCDDGSLPCVVYVRDKQLHRTDRTKDMCCTGLCIDLLKRLSEILHFEVKLSEVPDGGYGSPLNKNLTIWNGMLGMLIHNEADMAIGALSITPERSVAVDFSVPFLQTGIAIIVAIREGVISPTAFLEPYDYPSWSLILVFSVHATGASIFIFEWLSPYGLDQGKTPLSVHKFSLFRSFWLIWAMLFGASVSTDQPRGIASRFLANIWALFAVVFCASYTANLAAFMITKDDFYDLSGIQDWRLKNPHHRHPPFKFATIANSSTDLNIEKNYKEIHRYMKSEAQTDVKDAIRNLKKGHIQAFIYDSTTLEYEVGKDDFCKLKTVGKRIAETGYGVAFPRKSQWVQEVNKALLHLQENGDIERLQKFWLAGACHKKKEPGVSSHTLGILNFTSAFILLGAGVVLGVVLLILEHMYFRFGRKSLRKWDKHGCCSLVSLSMGQSLTFEQSVMEAIDYHKHHKCKDPLCETQLWKVKYDLDIALLKISQLRKQIAYSASMEFATKRDDTGTSMSDLDVTPYQYSAARRRRQQASDASPGCVGKSLNQPLLLALEEKGDTADDDMHDAAHLFFEFPPKASTGVKVPARESNIPLHNIHHFYCEKHKPCKNVNITSGGSKTTTSKNITLSDEGYNTVAGLDLHALPPSFEEVVFGYVSSPDEIISMSPIPQLPPPTPPSLPHTPPATSVLPHQNRDRGVLQVSDSNTSNLPSSLNNKHFVSDSSECLSSFSLSEEPRKHLKPFCAVSKFLNESPSTGASQASPDILRSLDDSNASSSPVDNHTFNHSAVKHSGVWNTLKPETKLTCSRGDNANNVSQRQPAGKFNNIYVNVDEVIGKETSF